MKLFGQQRPTLVQQQTHWQLWQQQKLAADLLNHEKALITPWVKKKRGCHLLQLSIAGSEPLYEASSIPNQTFVELTFPESASLFAANSTLVCDPRELAVSNDSLDCMIVHHILEFTDNPHQILREAYRALVSGGQLYIIGFNPWSLMGLRKALTFNGKSPWSGHYRSSMKLTDWLKLLGFEVESIEFAYYKLPLNKPEMLAKSRRIEALGRKYNCFFGSTYAIVASKKTAGMTPLYETQIKRQVLTFPVTEPTTRSINYFV